MEDKRGYWLALTRIRQIRPPLLKDLMAWDIEEVFASRGSSPRGLPQDTRRAIRSFSEWDWVREELERIDRHGVRIVTIKDSAYPKLLRHIYDPPPVLYVKGRLDDGGEVCVGVVGTRRPSHYGLSMAERISSELASRGISVVSGMARGCDSQAHRGAISAGGRTIAVVGCGIDVVYPSENRALYREIAERGCILSEFPFSTPPFRQNFPRRNRIISGMSLGVVVVEAPARSGAIMTARLALEHNRDVFAIPGQADSRRSAGTNRLIKEGAMLVESADDIISALGLDVAPADEVNTTPSSSDSVDGHILRLLEDGPVHIDVIIKDTGLPPGRVSALLLDMELKGLVEQHHGKYFTLKHRKGTRC